MIQLAFMLLGLVIVSLDVGMKYDEYLGWFVLGCGLVAIGAIWGMLSYLDNGNKEE